MMMTRKSKYEFTKLYADMLNVNTFEHSLFAMGTFAYFMEKYLESPLNKEVRKEFLPLVGSRRNQDKQDAMYMIAFNVVEHARANKRGENLDFRLKRIKESYDKGMLTHFEVFLDEYDFPEWFQVYVPVLEEEDSNKIFELLLRMIPEDEAFENKMIELDIVSKVDAFAHRVNKSNLRWKFLILLTDALQEGDLKSSLELLDFKIPQF